jgi:hypothetical protein
MPHGLISLRRKTYLEGLSISITEIGDERTNTGGA